MGTYLFVQDVSPKREDNAHLGFFNFPKYFMRLNKHK